MAKKPTKKSSIDSVEIDVLEPYQQSRIRAEMWLGSRDPHHQEIISYGKTGEPVTVEYTWVPALFTAIREVWDNALDEMAAKGFGERLDITFDPKTMTVKIGDNGRGIPIAVHPEFGLPQATLALSRTFSGRNFKDEDRAGTRGMNGVGASIVNFCSEWFKLDIRRDGKAFSQNFAEGETELKIEDPLILPHKSKETGTTIQFKLSKKVFKHFVLPVDFVRDRALELALCYPSIKVFFNGEHLKALGGVERTIFKGKKPIAFEINEAGFQSRFWLLPEFLQSSGEHAHGLVNGIPVFDGGTHIEAFKRNFYSGMIKAMEPMSKRRKLNPNRSDLADGMLIYNITQMDAPSFGSQSKTRLINENVGKIITKAMDDPEFFKSVVKKNPEWIEQVYERCKVRTQKSDASELAKLNKAAKKQKVESLIDATGSNRQECILYITEGESAKGGLVNKRIAKRDGVLPLRGKIMNVRGESLKTIASSDALIRIMNSIGLEPGKRVNRHSLRYGKVYFTCDADEDGHSIVALLTNFAYTLWPELFKPENPFFYSFETPLVVASKGKQTKYWYADNYDSFDSEKHKGWVVRRCKGLAALSPDDWEYALRDPKLIPITDDGELSETLDMLFNPKRSDDRKLFMGL